MLYFKHTVKTSGQRKRLLSSGLLNVCMDAEINAL